MTAQTEQQDRPTVRRITPEQRAGLLVDFRRRYKAGQSVRFISEQTGYGYGVVWRTLTDGKVKMRRRGKSNGTKHGVTGVRRVP